MAVSLMDAKTISKGKKNSAPQCIHKSVNGFFKADNGAYKRGR